MLLTEWLTFLPEWNISAMYQRPQSEEVVLFIDDNVCMFDIHSLQLVKGFPQPIATLGVPAPFKINAQLHTYTGRTLLFYNEEYYGEMDECSFKIKKYGYTRDYFYGLPKGIDGAFRYIDGNIYFFKDRHIYVYNEF